LLQRDPEVEEDFSAANLSISRIPCSGPGLPEIMQLLRSSPRNAHAVRPTPTDTLVRNHQQNFVIATTDLFENDILVTAAKFHSSLGFHPVLEAP
jgi:hypothetical protein